MKLQLGWWIVLLSGVVIVLSTGAQAQTPPAATIPQARQLTQQPPSDHGRRTSEQLAKRIVRKFDFLDDVELIGRNYAKSKSGKTVPYADCKKACLNSKSCKGFTYFSDGRCHLKESITRQRKAPGDRSALLSILRFRADSNQIELDRRGAQKVPASPAKKVKPVRDIAEVCGRGYYAYPSQVFQGFNLTLASNLVTLHGCRRLCDSNRRCKGFSWYGRPGSNRRAQCWMKRRISKPIRRSNRLACEKIS